MSSKLDCFKDKPSKGQLISEGTVGVFKSPKKRTNFLKGFLPQPQKWVESKR